MVIEFSRKEISEIDKNLGFIVFDWAKNLINHIISQARDAAVNTVYINTLETLEAGTITEGKVEYFYEKLPSLLGFKKEKIDLRGRGPETLWAYHLDVFASAIKLIKTAKQIALENIPKTYQGAFISIIGKKPYYDEEEFAKVLNILEKKKIKPKIIPKFYYDWGSRQWTGAQRFSDKITENVVIQKITSDVQNLIQKNPALLKFWALLLSQSQHFGNDVIGFALVSKIRPDAWVINEIQTDAINVYMKLRRIDKNIEERGKEREITVETLIDMLRAQNRSKWIPKIEANELFRNQLLRDPNIIQQLPDDTHNIDEWIGEQNQQTTTGMDLIQHFNSVDFNTRIFRLY